jgi:hypothetical protein
MSPSPQQGPGTDWHTRSLLCTVCHLALHTSLDKGDGSSSVECGKGCEGRGGQNLPIPNTTFSMELSPQRPMVATKSEMQRAPGLNGSNRFQHTVLAKCSYQHCLLPTCKSTSSQQWLTPVWLSGVISNDLPLHQSMICSWSYSSLPEG